MMLFFIFIEISNGQVDSVNHPIPLTSIGDSTALEDSVKSKILNRTFLIRFDESKLNSKSQQFSLTKKEIDFTNYRYLGNVLSNIPFGMLNDFGSLGAPNEANLYNLGFGNISVIIDNISISGIRNASNDLNIFQTEEINSISIEPLSRGFLHGFSNNPSSLIIETNDTLKSKPITRLRYYQAPNEEGFVDAMFSARVLPKLALAMRLTNSSIDENYSNTEFGAWQFNVKGIYKFTDSIFAKLNFNHAKLTTPLNGGIDISQLEVTSNTGLNFYSTEFPVNFSDRNKSTTNNDVTGLLHGKLLPFGYSRISFSFSEFEESLQYTIDTTSSKLDNYSRSLSSTFINKLSINNFSSTLNAGYEKLDLKMDEIFPKTELNNYYASISVHHNFLNKSITPSIFGKYSYFNQQSALGLGADILFRPINNMKLLVGYSNFEKPLSPIESQYLDATEIPSYKVLFTSINFGRKNYRAGLSYFNITSNNNILPVNNNAANSDDLTYVFDEKSINSGINFNSNIEFWNILTTANINYYWQNESQFETQENILSINAGIFYVDTLYNDNLNLKTGFIFKLFDNPNYAIYNFQHMRSAGYRIVDEAINKLSLQSVLNDKMRVDFYLAGRIQDAATFYFIYENILGNNYFIVPYYPMPEGGMRIGISWDFLD